MTAAESDLRGEVALAIMALLTWAEFHGGITPIIDGTVERFITAGKPADPGINRAINSTRRALARYVASVGAVPSWFPPSLLKVEVAENLSPMGDKSATESQARPLAKLPALLEAK